MNGKRECPLTDEIVSYIYGEIDGVERNGFETHLADCVVCTDDFAAISNARFSVFEWRKEEFDKLATPSIVIPELAKSAVVINEDASWFGALAGVMSFARSPLAAAALLLGVLGVGFIALAYLSDSEALMASNAVVRSPVVENSDSEDKRFVIDTPSPVQLVEPATNPGLSKPRRSYEAVPAATRGVVQNKLKQGELPRIAKKPVLNDFQDDADDSLRLTKLLDEIGG